MPVRPTLFLRLNRAREAVFHRLNIEALSHFGVTVPQLTTLFFLQDHGQTRPGAIAEALGVDASAVTRLVARLEKKALVTRVEAKSDRRVRLIELTDAGHAKANAGAKALAIANNALTEPFDAAEIATIERFFDHAIAVSQNREPKATP